MKKRKLLCMTLLSAMALLPVKADEGMWLLQLMKEQHLTDQMVRRGLKLTADDLYSTSQPALKDAVGIFGGGCTGEIISGEGLILTNHHCGYGSIQQHSSEEHDYLTNGFWAKNRSEELATPGLKFTFVEKIVDVTDSVLACISRGEADELEVLGYPFLERFAERQMASSEYDGKAGMEVECLPFYGGNRYYLFYKKVYTDVRMVAAPPSSIGKFGGEKDNWMWPRHTGDFSIFRIYADKDGEPADYSPENVPLKTPKHLTISLSGIQEGDYAMIMGFPGSTERFLTRSQIQQMMDCENTPRIQVREARQEVLKAEMAASHKVRIQYASKYAQSSNYWKNSIGMNKAIVDNRVREMKSEQEARFTEFADASGHTEYQSVVSDIDGLMESSTEWRYLNTAFVETFMRGIEFGAPYVMLDSLKSALQRGNKDAVEKWSEALRGAFHSVHNKDYDHEVDRKVAKVLFPLFEEMAKGEMPSFYETIRKKYKGRVEAYVDDLYDNSIFSSEKNLEKFLKKPTVKAIERDLAKAYSSGKWDFYHKMQDRLRSTENELQLLHKTYVRGLCEMYAPVPKSPDANFTIRLTYGSVEPYSPADGVRYDYFTALEGVMQKEDAENPEFIVPEKLKQLYEQKDYGRYAMKDGRMPVCFITTNDITGGNSGSPVMDAHGRLIGSAFDGNWESLSGDINFDNEKQRCIVVDIRYILFVLDKLGGCGHLIEEMTISE
ncbi:MAG: S46 family peptidase [Bacteroidaceae bacterium]|nr:S46 family peptidase [Bacteroidaceae bacterium]